jgi:serine protease Do
MFMNAPINLNQRAARAGIAVFAAALLVSGAAWRGFAADSQSAAKVAPATTTTPITHAIAGGRDSYADIVNVAAPAVVTVRVAGKARVSPTGFDGDGDQDDQEDLLRRFFGDRFGQRQGPHGPQMPQRAPRQRGLGSGVMVTTDGYILTNNHVVEGADDIKVDLTDNRTLTAKLVGTDKASDLALLKVTGSDFKPIPLGNSDNVQVGDVVLAVGNPMGIGQTVTMGIISAKGRSTAGPGDGSYEDFLQTDAPINRGNSGGALVNMKGELVGINSQILSNTDGNIGIGFSIPVNMAKSVMDQLRSTGKVTRSQLGVTVQQVTSDIAQNLGLKHSGGAIVSSVTPGSAADKAGVKQGDVIESFNGQPVQDFNSLRNRVAATTPGTKADLTVVRDGAEKHLSVQLAEANPSKRAGGDDGDPDSTDKAALGVSVAPLTPEMASRLGTKSAQGLVVQNVDPDGRAADAGIRSGDVIESVNRQPVKSVEDLRSALKRNADRPVLLLINRQGSNVFVTVKPANG